jgi:hypothetical protein
MKSHTVGAEGLSLKVSKLSLNLTYSHVSWKELCRATLASPEAGGPLAHKIHLQFHDTLL